MKNLKKKIKLTKEPWTKIKNQENVITKFEKIKNQDYGFNNEI